ncbi:TetR/AcrR family transcriptional regulator [Oleisolibacter albus]|uniref:TetR/AcrR family transcriptional regulator n=1 Tax=Oleisolibacter albus TaxID=2171757 RepID=UPI000DF1AE3B|nr:TetR/AcrR family transcriptional regulator [Oleisolibacter albus]
MAYRRTDRVEIRLAETRERIVGTALALVAAQGYGAAGMPAVAAAAGVSTGLLYRYFPSKAALFDEVFRRATAREIEACTQAVAAPGPARDRLSRLVQTFARRALKGRRLAWALLAEPAEPVVEADRLRLREPYRALLAGIIRDGMTAGEIRPQDEALTAAALVGAIAEALRAALTGAPAGEPAGAPMDEETLVAGLTRFCVQALGPPPD